MSLDEMMKTLRVDYIADLPKKIIELKTWLEKSDNAELQDGFHKLKGSGLTYGVPEISELGAVAEKLCMTCPQSIPQIIPTAIELLQSIHDSRQNNDESFAISQDSRFQSLAAQIKN